MPNVDSKSRFEGDDRQSVQFDCLGDRLAPDQDLVMEQILESINSTPIGQVLKRIASLPEVRKEKVLDLRRKITDGEYDLNERLDLAVDKVLEQLTT
jgi:anti-sigma28 factor (negative regulator of flagellin synthesis)